MFALKVGTEANKNDIYKDLFLNYELHRIYFQYRHTGSVFLAIISMCLIVLFFCCKIKIIVHFLLANN